ncbi:MAG: transposase [Candidatus Brennerbacteria bacterium]|nr:transposase [Candidatus Brennerbacteria bacterium]
MQRIKPAINEIYHLYNRGVEKRKIFLDDNDYLRFVHDLFEFNDQNPTINLAYHIGYNKSKEVGLPKIEREPRQLLVELLIFCLMPNHFHLVVKQKVKNGITEFMRKLGTGYTNYFNKKYERVGSLFQGIFKIKHIINETHFVHLPYYIHCNPLDLIAPEWKKREFKNYHKIKQFLEFYRWSSHLDYLGKKNFPSVTQREFLLKYFGGHEQYKKDMADWLRNLNLEEIKDVTLE